MLRFPGCENIRIAEKCDLSAISQLFQKTVNNMNIHGIDQWDEKYPARNDHEQDIEKKCLYLYIIDNQIAAAFTLNQECDPKYTAGSWQYPESDFAVLHRFCVSPELQNQGLGLRVMSAVERITRTNGMETIRLDSYSQNPYALKLYRKLNYCYTGTVNFRKGSFYLFEKKL